MHEGFQFLVDTVSKLSADNPRIQLAQKSQHELSIAARGRNCVWTLDQSNNLSVYFLEEFVELTDEVGPNLRFKLENKRAILKSAGAEQVFDLKDLAEDGIAFVLEPSERDYQP